MNEHAGYPYPCFPCVVYDTRTDITQEEWDALNTLFKGDIPGHYISNAQTKEMLDKLPKRIDENGIETWTWKLKGHK